MNKSLLTGVAILAAGLLPSGVLAGEPVPFLQDFGNVETNAVPEGWITADLNNDGKTWGGYYGQLAISDFFTAPELNDWVFSTPIALEQGKTYLIELKLSRGYAGGNPNVKVALGKSQTPEGMTETLLEKELTDYFAQEPSQIIFKCNESGDFSIGVFASSEGACVQYDDLSVREATMPAAPSAPEILKSDTYGSPNVTVRFYAPDKDMSGNSLSSISRISVIRSGVNVKEIENPTPGELIEFEDICSYGSGNYVWKATAYDADGNAGMSAESKPCFVGVNAPGIPQNLMVSEENHSGILTVTWDEVTVDRDGVPMPSEFIDYQIIFNGSYLESTGAKSPYTIIACEAGEQTFATVQVVAKSSYGSGVAAFGPIVAGTPRTNLAESFDDGVTHTNIRPESLSENPGQWFVFDDAMLYMYAGLAMGDADETNGCAAIMGQQGGATAGVQLGKFDLSGIEHPAVTFYVYFSEMSNGERTANRFELLADLGKGFDKIAEFDMADDQKTLGWSRVTFPLDDFKVNDINLKLQGTIVNNTYSIIDAIRVQNLCDRNLAVTSVKAPAEAKPDEEILISAKIENLGNNDMEISNISLVRNGKVLAGREVPALDRGKGTTVSFFDKLSLLDGDEVEYSVILNEDDDDLSDNTSTTVKVANRLPSHPSVTDLSAKVTESTNPFRVTLAWSQPDLNIAPEPVTESFEDGKGGDINNFGDWSFVDLDEEPTTIVDDYDPLPGQGSKMAAFIVDTTGHMNPYVAHTGSKFMAMQPCQELATDDWLISPELTGAAQTVTFFARSYDQYGYYRENFTFEISSASAEPSDFVPAETGQPEYGVPGSWTEYSFDLPEGSKYFAIHYSPEVYDGIMLMLDDFTFISAASATPLQLEGYNVFRDGEKLNETPVSDCEFVDNTVSIGEHNYQVTALYDRGESRGSNVETVTIQDFTSVRTNTLGTLLRAVNGGIEIIGNTNGHCVVTHANGMKVADRIVNGSDFITLAPGIYIVSLDGKQTKLIVR